MLSARVENIILCLVQGQRVNDLLLGAMVGNVLLWWIQALRMLCCSGCKGRGHCFVMGARVKDLVLCWVVGCKGRRCYVVLAARGQECFVVPSARVYDVVFSLVGELPLLCFYLYWRD